MMGVTHVFVGTMSAVILTELESPGGCLAALIGGSLGGIVCDIDLDKRNHPSDAKDARYLAGAIALACFAADLFLGRELLRGISNCRPEVLAARLLILAVLWIWGRSQSHRGGTHSILALVLFTGYVKLVCSLVSRPFLIGMASHLVLDILNRKPLQLLYPLRGGCCLGIARADGLLDRCLRAMGLLGTIFAVGVRVGTLR